MPAYSTSPEAFAALRDQVVVLTGKPLLHSLPVYAALVALEKVDLTLYNIQEVPTA